MKALEFIRQQVKVNLNAEKPKRKKGEALVRVTLAGVCNTDLELIKGYMGFEGTLGHEFVGVVEEADASEWIGKRVCADINAACGTCEVCVTEQQPHHCPNRTVLGILSHNGAFADYLVIPEANLYEVPEGVSDEQAVFTEPLAAAYEIPSQMSLRKTDRVVVLGDGKLGLLIAQVLRLYSDRVTLLGKHPEKLAIAEKLGIQTQLAQAITETKWADVVVEATGSASGLTQAMGLVKPRGTIVLKSTVASMGELNLAPLVIDEITVIGSRCGPFAQALQGLATEVFNLEPMIQGCYPLVEADKAIEHASRKGTLKILVKP